MEVQAEDKRELIIQNITELLRRNEFSFEFKVVKKPKGLKVTYEVTQEEMDKIITNTDSTDYKS